MATRAVDLILVRNGYAVTSDAVRQHLSDRFALVERGGDLMADFAHLRDCHQAKCERCQRVRRFAIMENLCTR